jgi:hypothetical protein
MCLTGGFALSMALDPVVLAPVLAQPGLPATRPAALDISPADLARVQARTRDGLELRAIGFKETLSAGHRVSRRCAQPSAPHSLARSCPTVPPTPPA